MDILPLVQKQHSSQITYSFVSELLGCNQLQTLQLKGKKPHHQTIQRCKLKTPLYTYCPPPQHNQTYLSKVRWVAQHVHIKQLCDISATVRIVFLSKGRADSSALFLDHLTLLCLGPCCPDSPDQLPQSDRSWHSLENTKKGNQLASGQTSLMEKSYNSEI